MRPFEIDSLETRGVADQPLSGDAESPDRHGGEGEDNHERHEQRDDQCHELRELCLQRALQRPDDRHHEQGEGEGREDRAARNTARTATRIAVQMASRIGTGGLSSWSSRLDGAMTQRPPAISSSEQPAEHSPPTQNDPSTEPSTMTTARATVRRQRDNDDIAIAFAVTDAAHRKQRHHGAVMRQAIERAGAHHGDAVIS